MNGSLNLRTFFVDPKFAPKFRRAWLLHPYTAMSDKPYAIQHRTFLFACDVIKAFPQTRLNAPSIKVWSQLIAASSSSGAHLEEAAAGGTRAHFLSLTRGALREMREANYWLRILTATELTGFQNVGPLVAESQELVAILSAIVRKTYENSEPRSRK